MTRESIIEQVNAILAEEFEIDQDLFTPNANVKEHSRWTASVLWIL